MIKAGILTILLMFIVHFGGVGQSPEVNCVSVAPNGNVTINWTPPVNMQSVFVQYNIYSDASGGFSQEGTVTNFNSSVFVHAGANANVSIINYYVTLVYNNGTADVELPALDTLSSLLLNVSNPSDGTAILQWSDLSNPISSDNGNYYYIQRQINSGVWQTIDSVLISDINYYRDTISICSANMNYQVFLENSAGCQSLSSIDGDLFQDLIPPASPIMSSVTVDTTSGDALLTWYPSTSMDAAAYIVMQNIGGVWSIIDTVYGYDNTSYLNSSSNADLLSETYGIAAFDSCWNGNPPAPNTSPLGTPHVSLFATNTYRVCSRDLLLKWNGYHNWDGGVSKYNVYRSVDGSSFSLVAVNGSLDSNYSETLDYGLNYCYVIEAVSNNLQDTAISNISCRLAKQPNSPKYAYVQTVTVEDSLLTVRMHPDLTGTTKELELFRSMDGINFISVYTENNLSAMVEYIDEDVDVETELVWYYYTVRDSCDNVILTSNSSRNILLEVTADQNSMSNFLQWNSYKNWNGNLMGYEIYRSINGIFELNPIASLGSNTFYYEDDISSMIGSDVNGKFCYYVKAIESANVYGLQETAESNITCVTQNSLVYIPNAIVIGGINSSWKPVINLFDYSSYSCKIFNRLGQVIFETSDSEVAWDAQFRNEPIELGVYIYQVNFYDGNGKEQEFWGSITVLR